MTAQKLRKYFKNTKNVQYRENQEYKMTNMPQQKKSHSSQTTQREDHTIHIPILEPM